MKYAYLHEVLLDKELRTKCPGLAEPVYEFAKYIGEHIFKGEISPDDFCFIAALSLADVECGRCRFNIGDPSFPQYLAEHKDVVLLQSPFVLQIIDALTDEEFAMATRKICKDAMGWDPPKKPVADNIRTAISDDCPANIAAAVDWWKNTLTSPKMDNGDAQMDLFMALLGSSLTRGNTEEAIAKFCEELIKLLLSESKNGRDTFNLDVDYGPGEYLYDAAKNAGVRLQFPCKTNMRITPQKVSVSYGYCAPWEDVWMTS